MRVTWAR